MISLRNFLLFCAVLAGCLIVRADVSPDRLEIVTGANPSKTEAFAASELARYIERMTGVAPEVRSDHSGKAFPIFLGRAADEKLVEKFNHSVAHIEHDAFVIEFLPDRINAIGNSDRGTLYAAYEAVERNKPLTEIVMTVSGDGIAEAKNLKVTIGTPFADIAAFCGGEKEGVVKYVAGGPMMGKNLVDLNQYARKTDSGLLFLTQKEACLDEPTNCINCGKCAKNCPMRLMPMYIELFTLAGDYQKAAKYGAPYCIECGSCAYSCPAGKPLVQYMRLGKEIVREAGAAK